MKQSHHTAFRTGSLRHKCHFIHTVTNPLFWRNLSLTCTFVLLLALPAMGQDPVINLTLPYYDQSVKKSVTSKLSFVLKSRAERRRVLEKMVWHEFAEAGGESLLLPRPGVALKELDKAIAYARENLREVTLIAEKVRPLAHQDFNHRHRDYILDVFALAGESSDAALLLENYIKYISSSPQIVEGRQLVNIVAQIESRLGTLRSGELVKIINAQQPHASKNIWGVDAAVQLHRRGVDIGTEILLSHLSTPPKDIYSGHRKDVAWALLTMDDPQVLNAMRYMLKTVLEKYESLVASGYEYASVSRAGIPATLYLLTYGNDEDIVMLSQNPVDSDYLMWMAPLFKDPLLALEFLMKQMSYPKNIGEILSVLTTYPEDTQQDVLDQLLQIAVKKTAFRFEEIFRDTASPFWPSAETALRFTEPRKFHPAWIPMQMNPKNYFQYWHTGALNASGRSYEKHLAHFDTAYLSDQIFAHYGTDNWKTVLDAYLMLHGLSTPSSPLQTGLLPDGRNYEPFGLRHSVAESNWAGVILGRISYDAQWIDDTLRIGFGIYHDGGEVTTGDEAAGSELQKQFASYLARDGKDLLESLNLIQNGKVIPLEAMGIVRDGLYIYQVRPPVRNFAGTYLDVRLKFFDQRRLIRFALYRGRVAKDMERAITRTTLAQAALKAEPEAKISLLTEYAGALADKGEVSQAWDVYQKAISKGPSDARTWQLAARMYLERHLYERGIEVLQDAVSRNPGQTVLWSELARAFYIAGDYPACIKTTEKILALDPDNTVAIYRRGVCMLLTGEKEKAGELLGRLPAGFAAKQVGILRYLATKTTKSGEADKALLALRDSLTNDAPGKELCGILLGEKFDFDAARPWGDDHECKRHYFAGYCSLLDGDPDDARTHFEKAIATHRNALVEYRLAEAALRTMEK